ncbi:16S rRNA (uracil(1498)-N(3))-methyltransferase [uncultured Brevundimonas sp.]|uniref:16S rRNA (uracil(1498)-N(3))-methyltransferase n=1 Tax=uncultured Brevundimonas sp. TaxID=213418 RepID=UPI0030EB2E23
MIRLFVPQPLTHDAAIMPTLDQSRYLSQVMRLKIGDSLLVFNGVDGEWRCVIAEVLKKGVVLRAEDAVRPQATGPDVELLISVVKKSALEFAVEKATELGVRRVRLVITHRTQTQHVRMDRLDAIAIEAAEQTGRLDVPLVDAPVKLGALLDDWPPDRRLMFCDESGGAPVMAALNPPPLGEGDREAVEGVDPSAGAGSVPPPPPFGWSPSPDGGGMSQPWAVLIGPEGGFAPEERERLLGLPFTTAVSLGPRILRADTAAIAALTLWQAAVGDWDR